MSAIGEHRPSSAYAEVGPRLQPIGALRAVANEAQQLVPILTHAVATGDHLRAQRTFEKLQALVGTPADISQGD